MRTNGYILPALLALSGACGGGDTVAGNDTAHLSLTLRGFVSQPFAIAAVSGGSARYAAAKFDVKLTKSGTSNVVAQRTLDGSAFLADTGAGASGGKLDVTLPPQSGTYTLAVTASNAAGELLYSVDNVSVSFDASGTSATTTATLAYVGPGRDITSVAVTPAAITVEAFQTANVTCNGSRADGSTTTDFPRTLSSEDPAIVSVNPLTGLLTGQRPGSAGVQCRIAFGTLASSRTAITVTNRTPTTPGSIVMELPTPVTPTNGFVVPVGTRVSIRVRVFDTSGGYAAGATVRFNVIISNGSCEPAVVTSGNDGVAESVFTVGAANNNVRVNVDGITQFVTFARFGS